MSPLNHVNISNKRFMSSTPETSHSLIGPSGPEQSPFGESFMHARMAFSSSDLDCGENIEIPRLGVDMHTVRDIDPEEP